jgi:hypothetical protein
MLFQALCWLCCSQDLSGLRAAAEKWVQVLRLQLKSAKKPAIDLR